jgi:hypothetical protein
LDAVLGGQADNFEFSEFLTHDDHLAAFWGFAVILNNCSNYKIADSRAQIGHARLKIRLSQGDFKRNKSP